MAGNFSAELKKILRDVGCSSIGRGKGDHEIWYSPLTDRSFPVDSEIKSRCTANGALKQAGLPKRF